MTEIETAGMLGNAYTESADTFSPSKWQDEAVPCSWARDDGSCGIGIFQYTYGGPYDSWVPLSTFAKQHGESPLTTNAQLDFAVYELHIHSWLGYSELQQDKTPQDAAKDFEKYFERPNSLSDEQTRADQAEYIYEHFRNGGSC
jgi:hypothetical protein